MIMFNHPPAMLLHGRFIIKISNNSTGGMLCILVDAKDGSVNIRYGTDPKALADWADYQIKCA